MFLCSPPDRTGSKAAGSSPLGLGPEGKEDNIFAMAKVGDSRADGSHEWSGYRACQVNRAGAGRYPLSTSACYHADGNGNVTCLLRSDAGTHARYQYDPYGRSLSATGTLAGATLLRFSSKPVVRSATGGCGNHYYGCRFYDSIAQWWLNRDPTEESGGINSYGFVGNGPLDGVDAVGLLLAVQATLAAEPTLLLEGDALAAYDRS